MMSVIERTIFDQYTRSDWVAKEKMRPNPDLGLGGMKPFNFF
jgi:hypothetical protein